MKLFRIEIYEVKNLPHPAKAPLTASNSRFFNYRTHEVKLSPPLEFPESLKQGVVERDISKILSKINPILRLKNFRLRRLLRGDVGLTHHIR